MGIINKVKLINFNKKRKEKIKKMKNKLMKKVKKKEKFLKNPKQQILMYFDK